MTILEGRWVDRVPRRDDVRDWLLAETRLLPVLAPILPLDVPIATVGADDPLRVRHRIVAGDPATGDLCEVDGARLGAFLRTLHGLPPSITDGTGVRAARACARETDELLARFRSQVLPRLPAPLRPAAGGRLERG